MTLRCYIPKKFRAEALETIQKANEIMESYAAKGFSMTLRQVYYQFVARGLIENSDASYNRLGGLLSDARLAGLVSWDHLEDRDRNLMGLTTYNTPQGYIRSQCSVAGYRRDLWEGQPMRPEVWVEKKAMVD